MVSLVISLTHQSYFYNARYLYKTHTHTLSYYLKILGVVPSLNLQNFPKLNNAENIEKFMAVPETFPGNVDDLEMDYKPMNVVMSTTSSKDETFDLDAPGM